MVIRAQRSPNMAMSITGRAVSVVQRAEGDPDWKIVWDRLQECGGTTTGQWGWVEIVSVGWLSYPDLGSIMLLRTWGCATDT